MSKSKKSKAIRYHVRYDNGEDCEHVSLPQAKRLAKQHLRNGHVKKAEVMENSKVLDVFVVKRGEVVSAA